MIASQDYKSKYETPMYVLNDSYLTYRFVGILSSDDDENWYDAYVAVDANPKMFRDVVLRSAKRLRCFCPRIHTASLDVYSKSEIRLIRSVYKIAISKGYFRSDDTTEELFGLRYEFNMPLMDYLNYLVEERDKVIDFDVGVAHKRIEIPIMLTNQPTLLLRSN